MSKKRSKKAKKTTSKTILWLDFAVAIALTVSVLVGNLRGISMVEAAIVAGLWDGQLAVVIGLYLWKSKNENRSKHAMKLVKELAGKYGIDGAARIAEIVLKD